MERLKGYTTLPFHSTLRVLHLQVESAIPIVGCILGWLADIVMTHIGIDLKHRELAEK